MKLADTQITGFLIKTYSVVLYEGNAGKAVVEVEIYLNELEHLKNKGYFKPVKSTNVTSMNRTANKIYITLSWFTTTNPTTLTLQSNELINIIDAIKLAKFNEIIME